MSFSTLTPRRHHALGAAIRGSVLRTLARTNARPSISLVVEVDVGGFTARVLGQSVLRHARKHVAAFCEAIVPRREVRVIDGDSIEAPVDLGLHSLTEQRLRLAQIDAPDIQTKAGRAARNFLIDVLAPAETIVLNTIKADVHGRYVVHVFCAPRDVSIDACFESGLHVNDLIVREKHAHVVG